MRWSTKPLIVFLAHMTCAGLVGCMSPHGWTDGQRNAWYVADQGSRLIPQTWIDALEQPGSAPVGSGKFTDPSYLRKFNYLLPALYARTNVDPTCPFDPNLPIGFVTDCQDDARFSVTNLTWLSKQHPTEPWVGLNCSACHTNAVDVHYADGKPHPDQTLIVDGAPTLADFQSFMAALEQALEQTRDDDGKFTRFAAAVLPAGEAEADKPRLKQAMTALINWNNKLAALNADQNASYGYGRLDAIGHIFNKVALVAMPDGGQTSNPADAPVSYPFLWNVPQLDHVEWNGIARNLPIGLLGTEDLGALARNTGEVTGVFADITIVPNAKGNGYVSSALVGRLDQMEQQLRSLASPEWPARFDLDPAKVEAGRALFRTRALSGTACADCHEVPGGFHLTPQMFKTVQTPLEQVGTDIWMACNASFDQAKAGRYAGGQVQLVHGPPVTDPETNFLMLQTAVAGTLLGQKPELAKSIAAGLLGLDNGLPQATRGGEAGGGKSFLTAKNARLTACNRAMHDQTDLHYAQLAYKGRPLQGVWATAPYLHNGSAPTLYALLQAPADRPKLFCVGSRKFNPKEVGFEYKPPCPAGTYAFDVSGLGNSNAGHDYGNAKLTDEQRYDLIEYMKTL